MKRQGYIYEKIYDKDNIREAIYMASRNKNKERSVVRVLNNLEYHVEKIHCLIKNKKYKPSPYKVVRRKDNPTGKIRLIHQPKFFPDQIIHWALLLQTEHLFKRGMYKWTGASIKGRGQIYIKNAVQKWIRKDHKGTKYCLELDIKKYYQNVDKDVLKTKIRTLIKCSDTLNTFDLIIDSLDKGIPIGNYSSQWFANFYLQETDHFIKQELGAKYYARYMDDLRIFHPNKRKLWRIFYKLKEHLLTIGLELKDNYQLFPVDKRPVDFVGYVFTRDKTFVRKRTTLRLSRKYIKYVENPNIKNTRSLVSYRGPLTHSDSYMLKKKYFYNFKKMRKDISDYDKKNNKIKYTPRKVYHQQVQLQYV